MLYVHLRVGQVPMNLENALTALVTLCHAKMAGDLRPLWSPKGIPKRRPAWNSMIHQVLANNFGINLLLSASDTYVLRQGEQRQTPGSTGLKGALCGLTLGSH